jgi:hypothetical protein
MSFQPSIAARVLIMSGKLPVSPRCAKRQTKRLPGGYHATIWLRSDMFFVRDATSRGMSWGEIAGFIVTLKKRCAKKADGLNHPHISEVQWRVFCSAVVIKLFDNT